MSGQAGNVDKSISGKRWQIHPIYHHFHVPNSKFMHIAADKKEYRMLVEYNSKGLNDNETPYEKVEKTKRILVLGDSFAEGAEVKRSENFCELLEGRLNVLNSGYKYDVINCGVFGYSTILEYLFFKHEGIKYHPDLVILFFFVNDVYEDRYHKFNAVFDEKHLPTSVTRQVRELSKKYKGWKLFERRVCGFTKELLSKSKIYTFFKRILYKIIGKDESESEKESNPFFILEREPNEIEAGAWEDTFRYIDAISAIAKNNNAKFLLVSVPIESQLTDDPRVAATGFYFKGKPYSDRYEAILKNYCRKQGIEYISLYNEFTKSKLNNLYFRHDGHFNQNGHREVAKMLMDYLEKNGFVKN